MTAGDEVEARLRAAGGEAMLARLRHLDALPKPRRPPALPRRLDPRAAVDCDVAIVGGGLSLLFAPLLARRGLRVVVIERGQAAVAQREWNASGPELQALVHAGLCTAAELDALVVNRYRYGVCRWHGGGSYPVRGVLDWAVDAGALLRLARARAEAAGALFVEGQAAAESAVGPGGIELRLGAGAAAQRLTARLLLDGRGAASPHARADLVCPTVGGVMADLALGDAPDTIDPQISDILATTEGVEDGRQHLWEAFPGRPGETAVYLFYYARRADLAPGALHALYRRFFALLPRYKRGPARLVRPTFGLIPGWSRLNRAPRAPHPRIVLVGDAAARHSPLTFCGFGAMLRSLAGVVAAVVAKLGGGRAGPEVAVDDRALHAATGALTWILARPQAIGAEPGAANRLLDAAFASLHAMGPAAYAGLLQDSLPLADFVRFLRTTSQRRPEVYGAVWRALGPMAATRWALQLAAAAWGLPRRARLLPARPA